MIRRVLFLLLPFALAAASPAAAQTSECNPVDLPEVEEVYQGAGDIATVQGPFLIRCVNGAELRANQGTLNRLTRELFLVGKVDYRDAQRTLTSDQATYTSITRRLYATGNVVFTNIAEGTTIRGPELEYFATTPERPEPQVNAGSRPHLTLMPRDTARSDAPLEIDADRLNVVGSDNLTAFGSVVITRPDLNATADEARYQGGTETLGLRGKAVVKGKDNVLSGDTIVAELEKGALQEVRSRGDAVLEATDMRVTAPDVQLFFREELVERTVARSDSSAPASRPLAVTKSFRLEADSIIAVTPKQELERVNAIGRARGETKTFRLVGDSIEAIAPGRQLERVTAVGRARGETVDTTASAPAAGSADTATAEAPSLIASDWISGDTIIGHFARGDSATAPAPTEAADSAVELQRIVARGTALALYRLERDSARAEPAGNAAEQPSGRRAVNFVSADAITLTFAAGEVDVAELHGVRRGIYLDPAPPAAAPESPTATDAAAPIAGGGGSTP
ncbi:MAG: hypothetical protein KY464_11445 [Gemmatimonadetes bacterium]|nr:hypothetical protein [Gemmatimonadota bacterium]